MRKFARRALASLSPGLVASLERLPSMDAGIARIEAQTALLRAEQDALIRQLRSHDGRLDRLRALVAKVEPYQPLYGVTGVIDQPARASSDRAAAIAAALSPLPGRRVLDIGSSLGYMCFYLADRGAHTTGWDYSADNVEVARLVGEINGVRASFATTALDESSAESLQPRSYDAVLVLSVIHHVIHYQGLATAQRIVRSILDAAPELVLELAVRGEDPDLFWDEAQPEDPLDVLALVRDEVEVSKLGEFGTHLSTTTRPLYLVSRRKVVTVNGKPYDYDEVTSQAYERSPLADGPWRRRYYYSPSYVIKEYRFDEETPDNWNQILRELYLHTRFTDRPSVHRRVVLHDWEMNAGVARLVLERVPGTLLCDVGPLQPETLRSVVLDVLRTLADLRDLGFRHNDVRSWNIMVDGHDAWLLDYGRASHDAFEDDVVALAWAAVYGGTGGREPSADRKVDLPDLTPLDRGSLGLFADALRAGERDPRTLWHLLTDTSTDRSGT